MDYMDQIKSVAAAGARGYQQKFALERLAKIKTELLDAIDGATETQGRDSWLTELIRDVEYVEGQVKAMHLP